MLRGFRWWFFVPVDSLADSLNEMHSVPNNCFTSQLPPDVNCLGLDLHYLWETRQAQTKHLPEVHTFTVTLPWIGTLPTVSERQVGCYPVPAVSTSRCRPPAADPPGSANPGKSSRERTLCLELSRSLAAHPALPLWQLRTGSYSTPTEVRGFVE